MEEEELYTATSAIVKQRFYISLPALPLSLEGRSPFVYHKYKRADSQYNQRVSSLNHTYMKNKIRGRVYSNKWSQLRGPLKAGQLLFKPLCAFSHPAASPLLG